MNLYFGS